MIRVIFYSVRNILFYRQCVDKNPLEAFNELPKDRKLGDVQREVTDYLLSSVGLKVADTDDLRWIYLTRVQRDIVKMVQKHGFNVAVR